ncbi:MAG: FtsQ-type POTRA domain-containing protein [Rickettsia endosymbiont of Ixodes persulcatus]|nr:FtsQ-type POTRA domain-containing protein [Rickettsia endosymbiont of Ixodes persulcatus]
MSGNKNISDEQIISQMSNPIGENILTYNIADSEERINAIDTVDGVEIKKVFPNLLSIEVDESYPLFYQEDKDKTFYIDNKAKIVENSPENNDGLIKIRGAKLRNITGENFTSSEASLNFVKAIQEFSYIDKVKEIDLENKAEIGIMLNDIDVKFGDLNNISDKLKLLDKILNDIDQKGVLAVQIDLDNGKNPRVKVDDQSFSEDLNY